MDLSGINKKDGKLNISNRVFLFIPLFLFFCNNLNKDSNIYGKWESSYNDQKLTFVFNNDKTCIFKYFNKKLNKYEIINGNFKLDFSKNPISLSIRNIPQLNHSLHTIVKFIGEDIIRITGFSSKWRLRPISFEPKKTIELKRIS